MTRSTNQTASSKLDSSLLKKLEELKKLSGRKNARGHSPKHNEMLSVAFYMLVAALEEGGEL